jgi:hypothetical protein
MIREGKRREEMVGEEKGEREGRNRRQEAHSSRDIDGDQKRGTR